MDSCSSGTSCSADGTNVLGAVESVGAVPTAERLLDWIAVLEQYGAGQTDAPGDLSCSTPERHRRVSTPVGRNVKGFFPELDV